MEPEGHQNAQDPQIPEMQNGNDEPSKENKSEEQNESKSDSTQNKDKQTDSNHQESKNDPDVAVTNEKNKRHRRGKNESTAERTFKCPDCDKSYLSGPALVIHRKTKHGFNTEAEKKSRGRPKKEEQQENSYHQAMNKFNSFLNNDNRKIKEDSNNLEKVKSNFSENFQKLKENELFKNFENIEQYPLYDIIVNNWDKEIDVYVKENETLSQHLTLDQIFFLYLKEYSNKTNGEYFSFMNKFIILLREYTNSMKERDKDGKEYTQINGADNIPESCNDFFIDFMKPKNNFGLNEEELIELAQHFCFWLYSKKYTHSYLTLL